MDQFEAAKLKHQKNLERKQRVEELRGKYKESLSPVEEFLVVRSEEARAEESNEVPMEKEPVTAAIIEVKVTLPTGEFGFKFVKPAVMNNANPSKLTKAGFRNCILEGLRPLLGGLNDLP